MEQTSLKSIMIPEDVRFLDICSRLIQGKVRCVVTVNKRGHVSGIVSEGDVIRAFLKGANIYSPVRDYVNRSIKFLGSRDLNQARILVKKFGISAIPVLSDEGELLDIITISDLIDPSCGNEL